LKDDRPFEGIDFQNFFAADSPVNDPAYDRFKRSSFAQRVAKTIDSRIDPSSIVVAIYGAWGEGKTTVLNFIDRELAKSPNIICIRFNPWRFNDEVHLLQNFFKSLSEALGKSTSTYKEKIGKWIANYASMLTPFNISIPFMLEFSPGESLKSAAQSLSTIELDEIKQRIENFLKEEGKRIVVLMDDIDRLDRNEIQSIFKLVKLSADFAYTAYVLAFDEEMVSAALSEKYGSGGRDSGRKFLEKIVQVPLYLPAADKLALRKFFFDGIDEVLKESGIKLSEEQAQAFVIHFVYGVEIRLHTPRIAKCYRNVIGFSLPILKGHVNPVDLMLIEGVRVFYPKLYDTIRENPDVFLGTKTIYDNSEQMIKQRSLEIIGRGFAGLTTEETEAAKYLLKVIFPRLCGIFENYHYGAEWDDKWTRERRICSEECFTSFFSYTTSDDDVSDPELETFIKKIAKKSVEKITAEFKKLAEKKSPEKIVLKLMRKEKKILPDDIKNLAVALSKLGGIFPRPETMFSFTTAFSQAGILIGQFIRGIAFVKDRLNIAKAVISEGDPVPFALECFKWIRTTDDKGEQNRIFSIEDEAELAALVVSRIRQAADAGPIYQSFPDDAASLLYFWAHWGGKDETGRYINDSLDVKPNNIFDFLRCFLQAKYDRNLNLLRKEDFGKLHHEQLSKIIDPEKIYSRLHETYQATLEAKNIISSPEEKLAYQFMKAHKASARTKNTEEII